MKMDFNIRMTGKTVKIEKEAGRINAAPQL